MNEENNVMMDDNNKLRKYLILGGGVFVLFVVGIVVSKFLFTEPKKDNTTVILPQEIKKDDTKLFNDIPVEDEANNDNFQKPPVEANTQMEPVVLDNQTNQNPKPQNTQPISQPQQTQTKQVVQSPQPKEVPVVTQNPKPQITSQPKTTQNNVFSPKPIANKYYYIQVAAVTKTNPSKKFLNLIEKNGFSYKIVEVDVKGMKVKRVLVGPFSYQEAKNILPKVRQTISKTAFIKRLK
jgi:DedD protein